ncbi:MAG: type III-B CRISPR module RAMP protein Cmr1 [Magnetococcales bacterium]|nr:type III-B CRISPR module RAMP protein Cmr1 [Magnetococcales bacterium]
MRAHRTLGADATRTSCTLKIKIVTTLFGGTARPATGKVDRVEEIRESAIRGQLLFWWRALNGDRYRDPNALFTAERELWGGTQQNGSMGRSRVELKVTRCHFGGLETYKKKEEEIAKSRKRAGFTGHPV